MRLASQCRGRSRRQCINRYEEKLANDGSGLWRFDPYAIIVELMPSFVPKLHYPVFPPTFRGSCTPGTNSHHSTIQL